MFPFDKPAPPEEDGNQSLAVNTTDGSVVYDVAFALVWADDGGTVDTRNEAYAFASCQDCAAVAVGFQVVLIVGQADVIVPGKPFGLGELQLCPVPHLRPGQSARPHPGRAPER